MTVEPRALAAGEFVLGDQPGDGGVAGGRVEAEERLLEGEQHHQHGHRVEPGGGLDPEQHAR